jgi:hypothetical protein
MQPLRLAQRIVALTLMTILVIEMAPSETPGAFSHYAIPAGAQALSLPSFMFTREFRNSRRFPRLAAGEWRLYHALIRQVRQLFQNSFLTGISFPLAAAAALSPAASLLQLALLEIPEAPNPNAFGRRRERFKPPAWVKEGIDETAERTLDFMLEEGQMPQETEVRLDGTLSMDIKTIAADLQAKDSFAAREHYLRQHGLGGRLCQGGGWNAFNARIAGRGGRAVGRFPRKRKRC